jgi:hypothetical protein
MRTLLHTIPKQINPKAAAKKRRKTGSTGSNGSNFAVE